MILDPMPTKDLAGFSHQTSTYAIILSAKSA